MSEVTWAHPGLVDILNAIPLKVDSIIDVGCGRGVIGALARIYREPKRLVGIDVFSPYLEFCKKHKLYDELYEEDARNMPLPFQDNEFHVATCIEVLEHLPKECGEALIRELERIAKIVIITTPNVFFKQKAYDDNIFQRHVSKYTPKEFRHRGYRVKGIGNFILFGKQYPILSFLLSRFSVVIPEVSSHILCIKEAR